MQKADSEGTAKCLVLLGPGSILHAPGWAANSCADADAVGRHPWAMSVGSIGVAEPKARQPTLLHLMLMHDGCDFNCPETRTLGLASRHLPVWCGDMAVLSAVSIRIVQAVESEESPEARWTRRPWATKTGPQSSGIRSGQGSGHQQLRPPAEGTGPADQPLAHWPVCCERANHHEE